MSTHSLNGQRTSVFGAIAVASVLFFSPESALATNLGFENNNFDDWETTGTTSVVDNTFGVEPTEGSYQALLSTGGSPTPVLQPPFLGTSLEGGESLGTPFSGFLFSDGQITNFGNSLSPATSYTEGSAIKTTITANAGEILTFDYNFLTNEDSSQPIFGNDLGFFSINNQLISLAVFSDVESILVPSATSFSRETGYQEYSYTFSSSGTYTLGFGVVDGNDSSGDSALLVDHIQVVPEPLTILGTVAALGFGTFFKKIV